MTRDYRHAKYFGDSTEGWIRDRLVNRLEPHKGIIGQKPYRLTRGNPTMTGPNVAIYYAMICPYFIWYLWDVIEDVLPKDITALTDITDKADFLSLVVDTALTKEDRCFRARYEIFGYDQGSSFSLVNDDVDFVGTIDFPIGTGCTIADAYLIGEETGDYEKLEGGDIIPPMPANSNLPKSDIVQVVTLSVENGKHVQLEPKQELDEDSKWAPVETCRVFLKREDKYPTPGELLGLAISPFPEHPWFYQKSSPFIYSGHWIETTYYSSGVVISKSLIEDSEADEDYEYVVRIHGEEIKKVQSTDFAEYNIDDRVALIKTVGSNQPNMTWKENAEIFTTWRILPVTFYQET